MSPRLRRCYYRFELLSWTHLQTCYIRVHMLASTTEMESGSRTQRKSASLVAGSFAAFRMRRMADVQSTSNYAWRPAQLCNGEQQTH
mmetsp:Transcript_98154/g.210517  ORF Transcript_98154/g.210517 Transcript_98154/m.210517 type:complete len:87 (+) Transcript_98154:995-1255(+)